MLSAASQLKMWQLESEGAVRGGEGRLGRERTLFRVSAVLAAAASHMSDSPASRQQATTSSLPSPPTNSSTETGAALQQYAQGLYFVQK